MTRAASARQREHYERIHDSYEAHYYDSQSMRFRNTFVYDKLFAELDADRKTVADLACGSGFNSLAFAERYPGATIYGLDISTRACEAYRATTGYPAFDCDLTKGERPQAAPPADIAMIFGGLHHCVADLQGTFETIRAILKPGGTLLMFEPNKAYFLESVRKRWYRMDDLFDDPTEEALDHDELLSTFGQGFSPRFCVNRGGPAYFLVYNSLIFRIPLKVKQFIASPLFLAERLYNLLPGRFWYPYFVARWDCVNSDST